MKLAYRNKKLDIILEKFKNFIRIRLKKLIYENHL